MEEIMMRSGFCYSNWSIITGAIAMAYVKCVVHYRHLNVTARVVPLDERKFETLQKAKTARKILGGDNEHFEQCVAVPENFDPYSQGAHTECYKKFTLALSTAKKRNVLQDISNNLECKRLKRSGEAANQLFPDHCMFCKSANAIRVKGVKQFPHIIQTEETLIAAAKTKNDEQMMILMSGGNLTNRQFKVHRKCYNDYTKRPKPSELLDDSGIAEESFEVDPYDALNEFVQKEIIVNNKAITLEHLTEMCGKDKTNRSHRSRVKERLKSKFPQLLFFNCAKNKDSQIVAYKSEEITVTDLFQKNRDEVIRFAATALRRDVVSFIENAAEIPWPPRSKDLRREDRNPPLSVQKFFRVMLQDTHHSVGVNVDRLISSYSQDVVHAISKGKFLTSKHTLLSNTLHTITGQEAIVDIVHKFGGCGSYDMVRSVQTAQAELSNTLASIDRPLPLVPLTDADWVLTHFWWDNCDVKKENKSGSIHTTHGIAFQEPSQRSKQVESISIQRSGRKSITPQNVELPTPVVIPHKPPSKFKSTDALLPTIECRASAEDALFNWVIKRISNMNKQLVPRFVGYITKLLSAEDTPQTVITFLPPIHHPITEYSTVCETLYRSIKLKDSVNMKYAHITVDAGAAEKYFKVIWNNKDEFYPKVIIHLGDFHGFQHFFGNVGKFVTDSGFEDVIHQADLCSEGGMKSVLKGKSYNKCWLIHECMAEGIDRLIHEIAGVNSLKSSCSSAQLSTYKAKYHQLKNRLLNGELGLTAKYWTLYHDMVQCLHMLHYAININDFELRRHIWEELLKLSFSMNKQNYARYGTFYVTQLANLHITHPGAIEEIEKKGISVCRNKWGVRQSTDGAGEQTFMKNSKTAGGIKNFVQEEKTYEKWVLSRPGQADYVSAVKELTGLCGSMENPRKCLQKGQITKHEKAVQNIIKVFKEDFVNPFSEDLNRDELFNVASGKPASAEVRDCLLSVFERGAQRMDEFRGRLNDVGDQHLFTVLERVKWTGFETENMKVNVKVDGKTKTVSVQKDIFALIAAKSGKDFTAVDMKQALKFPLAPVSLPLATPDGCMRKTSKCKLYDALNLEQVLSTSVLNGQGHCHYILDLAAKLRTIKSSPKTFEDLALKIMADIPEKYGSLYIACDTYKDGSIKESERSCRQGGKIADRLLIKSPKVRVPSNFQQFLNNGENKERVFEIIESIFIESSVKLSDREVYFARKDKCIKITSHGVSDEFILNHEEADTKITFLTVYASSLNRRDENDVITIRSHSGDVDIPVIMLGNMVSGKVFLDNGTAKDRKIYSIASTGLSSEQKKAITGVHAFTGNDFNSSFLRKGKVRCWKVAQKHLRTFAELGEDFTIAEKLEENIEKFVLDLYGSSSSENVNEARNKIFWDTLKKKKKVVDLSMLPPCQASLHLHTKRSNYIAKIWKQASVGEMTEEPAELHGWNSDFTLKWEAVAYPAYVYDLLQQSSPVDENDDDEDEEEEFEDQEAVVFGDD